MINAIRHSENDQFEHKKEQNQDQEMTINFPLSKRVNMKETRKGYSNNTDYNFKL